jgi:septum site-determining protein MinC
VDERGRAGRAASIWLRMPTLRGKGLGLEIVLTEEDLDIALDELRARFALQPNFYRGSKATAVLSERVPSAEQVAALRVLLEEFGITLSALSGGAEIETFARGLGLEFTIPLAEQLSSSARSLVADFAGARADIVARRRRGESSVRRAEAAAPQLHLVESVTTLYHTGTLRGGQALHHVGNLVVVGDVNPGAEVVATGDVLVFGRLAGVAHAGAQGNEGARVYALQLQPVQLRIGSRIAAEDGPKSRPGRPEVALVRGEHIVITRFDEIDTTMLEAHAER